MFFLSAGLISRELNRNDGLRCSVGSKLTLELSDQLDLRVGLLLHSDDLLLSGLDLFSHLI